MKWFKHETTAHSNLKLQSIIETYGPAAYGYYWGCVELVAMQGGDDFTVKADRDWQIYLKKQLNIPIDEQKIFLVAFAGKNLIDGKALKKGDLSIPKLAERCDEYTEKIRRKSGQGRDNIGLEENRTEEIRKEQNNIFISFWNEYPSTKRNVRKADAEKKFLKGSPPMFELERRLKHLKKQKVEDRKWLGGFVPNLSTYLNQERWDMDIEKEIKGNNVKSVHVG